MNIMNYKASNLIHIANVKYEERIVLEEITFVQNLFLYLVWWLKSSLIFSAVGQSQLPMECVSLKLGWVI